MSVHAVSESLEKLRVTRRIGYFFTLWITYHAFEWATSYAENALAGDVSALEVAAILGAVLAPITALQGAVINFYHNDRPAPWQYQSPEKYTAPTQHNNGVNTDDLSD